MYLLGEPYIRTEKRRTFMVPFSQMKLSKKIVEEAENKDVDEELRKEYLSIVDALIGMETDFRIIFSDIKGVDRRTLKACMLKGCRLAGFQKGFLPQALAFPRDFSANLSTLILINDKVGQLSVEEKDGRRFLLSPYGEGGRILFSKDTAVLADKVILRDDSSDSVSAEQYIKEIQEAGIRVITFPSLPLSVEFSKTEKRFFSNDHIDRIAALIKDEDERLHIVIDPEVCLMSHVEGSLLSAELRREMLKNYFEAFDISVWFPKKLAVPYSLNLIQIEGRILMTGGDQEVYKIVSAIVGKDNVFQTSVPIKHFPVFAYGGIRCLINEAPPILRSI